MRIAILLGVILSLAACNRDPGMQAYENCLAKLDAQLADTEKGIE